MKEQPLPSSCLERGVLQLSELCFLHNGPYTLTVCPGDSLGLSGKSGVGKSLLLKAIADIVPWHGTLKYGRYDCHDVPAPVWRRNISLVPAESVWWHNWVSEHFDLSAGNETFLSLISRLGFERDILTWQISRLSSGEKQRLALLRGLVSNPAVLLLDEPTASLDTSTTERVEEVLIDFQNKSHCAIILVSHDPQQILRFCQSHYVVNKNGLMPRDISSEVII